MAANAKRETEKKKRGRPADCPVLLQCEDPLFERNYWWMNSIERGSKKPSLNKAHAELAPTIDDKSREITRAAPIVWEVLRRHPEVVSIRGGLTRFLPGAGGGGVHYMKGADDVIRKLGFEIEFLLARSGLNAWQSLREHPSDFQSLPRGQWPLDETARHRFEQLMDAYRHERRADEEKPSFWWMDLTQLAHSGAAACHDLAGTRPQKADSADPFSIFIEDAMQLSLLKGMLQNAKQSGLRLAVIAHRQPEVWHPAPESRPFDENDYLLLSPGSFKDFPSLVRKLKEQTDGVSKYLYGRLRQPVQDRVNSFGSIPDMPFEKIERLANTLSTELNELLLGPALYKEEYFKDVKLPANTKKLLAKQPRGDNLLKLNRLLIEAAFSCEIVKSSDLRQPATSREIATRRPKVEQLTWVYEVENGISINLRDYNRMMTG